MIVSVQAYDDNTETKYFCFLIFHLVLSNKILEMWGIR